MTDTNPPAETVHGCPPAGSGLTPCCGRTPFELPRTDRISTEAPITCQGAVSVPASAPTDWIDGHPQLEAIAAAVWERCGRSDSGTCVEDDPRNIAVAALAAVLPAPTDRAAILREAADRLARVPFTHVLAGLRRMADEAEYVDTPCSFGACEPGGEPCTTHERLMAHAEGDHELCAPDCAAVSGSGRAADETQAGVRCSAAVLLGSLHAPHEWQPQPGMPLVHCPGGQTADDGDGEQPAVVSQPGGEA